MSFSEVKMTGQLNQGIYFILEHDLFCNGFSSKLRLSYTSLLWVWQDPEAVIHISKEANWVVTDWEWRGHMGGRSCYPHLPSPTLTLNNISEMSITHTIPSDFTKHIQLWLIYINYIIYSYIIVILPVLCYYMRNNSNILHKSAFFFKYLCGAIPSLPSHVWKLRHAIVGWFRLLLLASLFIHGGHHYNPQLHFPLCLDLWGLQQIQKWCWNYILVFVIKSIDQHQASTAESTERTRVVTHWLLWCEQALIKQKGLYNQEIIHWFSADVDV